MEFDENEILEDEIEVPELKRHPIGSNVDIFTQGDQSDVMILNNAGEMVDFDPAEIPQIIGQLEQAMEYLALTDGKLDSQLMKCFIGDYFLAHRNYKAVFTEALNHSDVLAIRRSGFIDEVEVKVTRRDLQSELKAVANIFPAEKLEKHQRYLTTATCGQKMDSGFVPNTFSFFVPEELKDFALEELRGTPYGLYVLPKDAYRSCHIQEERIPIKLHGEKPSAAEVWYLVKKASRELASVRSQLSNYKKVSSSKPNNERTI